MLRKKNYSKICLPNNEVTLTIMITNRELHYTLYNGHKQNYVVFYNENEF